MGQIYSCKGCVAPKRHIGCHGTCEEYIREKEQYSNNQQMVRDIKMKDSAYHDYHKGAVEHSLRKAGRRYT